MRSDALLRFDRRFNLLVFFRALKRLESTEIYSLRCFNVIRILFDHEDEAVVQELLKAEVPLPDEYLNRDSRQVDFIDLKLTEDQRAAVDFSLRRKHLAIIQGPPGTGKTTTLVELIAQMCRFGKKVLVCAPTNVAVDNVALKLREAGLKPLRMGHPARIAKEVQSCSVDANVREDNAYEILVDIKETLKELREKEEDGSGRGKPWAKIKELSREYRDRMDKLTQEIIRRHSVGTLEAIES